MYSQNHKTVAVIFFVPGFHIRHCVQAVDAGVSPKINQHHFPKQLPHRCNRGSVDPVFQPSEFRRWVSTGNDDEAVSLPEVFFWAE